MTPFSFQLKKLHQLSFWLEKVASCLCFCSISFKNEIILNGISDHWSHKRTLQSSVLISSWSVIRQNRGLDLGRKEGMWKSPHLFTCWWTKQLLMSPGSCSNSTFIIDDVKIFRAQVMLCDRKETWDIIRP